VLISWSEAIANGAPILSYQIYLNTHGSDTYLAAPPSCDGTDLVTISDLYCWVALSDLIVAPYSLVLDEEIYAKIEATNFYGASALSEPGNNGRIQLIPDAPINLLNDATFTDATTIAFSWEDGPSNGSAEIYDYDVYYDQGTGSWVILEEEVTFKYY